MGANCGLMVADSNGGNKRLISRNANDSSPSWSPGGGYILFTSDRSGNLDVWMMRADGSDPRPLTTNPTSDGAATWSPDGNFIFFRSDRDGSWGIYMMDHEGGQQRKVVSANVSERWWWERVSVSR
jgi:Tol biopolymer transport system component